MRLERINFFIGTPSMKPTSETKEKNHGQMALLVGQNERRVFEKKHA